MRRLAPITASLLLFLAPTPLAGQTPAPSSDPAAAEPASSPLTPDDIIASWNARRRAIDAFECQAFVQEECRVREPANKLDPFADPFKGPGKVHTVTVRNELTVKRQDKLMAVVRAGESVQSQDPLHPTTIRTLAFAGDDETRILISDDSMDLSNMGTIFRGDLHRDSLVGYEDAVPMWMWYDPASVLQAYRCDLTQADIKESSPRLLLAFKDRTHRQLATHVEVDRRPPHVVYRVERKRNNKTIVDCQLVYNERSEPGDGLGPALKSWTYWRFGAGTTWETRRQGYVSKLTCPAKLTDDDFTFEFPVGTHIAESKGASSFVHWLQISPTERRRLTQGEYGRADVTR